MDNTVKKYPELPFPTYSTIKDFYNALVYNLNRRQLISPTDIDDNMMIE
jgi:hypothetical protein